MIDNRKEHDKENAKNKKKIKQQENDKDNDTWWKLIFETLHNARKQHKKIIKKMTKTIKTNHGQHCKTW